MSDLQYIYNNLAKGKTLELQFSDLESAVAFRNAFGVYKMRKDKLLLDVGILEDHDLQSVSYQNTTVITDIYQPCIFQISFTTSDGQVETGFTIIDDGAKGLT